MKIADLKATLGFEIVDKAKLNEFERRLKHVNRNLNDAGERFQKQLRQNNKKTLAGFTAIEKRVNRHRGQLFQMRNDYYRINQEFKQGNISHERRTRMLTEINRQYQQQKRHIRAVNREHARSPMGRMRSTARALNQPIRGATGGMGTGVRAGATAGIAARFGGPAAAAGAGVAAVGAGAFMSNQQYNQFIGSRTALQGITGSLEEANKKLRMLAGLSEYLGTNFLDSARAFTNWSAAIQGTSMEGASGDEAFRQLQAFFKSRDLGRPEQAQAMRAISQMLQKGTLYSEEVFGQLSEAGIPAQMLVDALGMKDIAELRKQLEAGNVRAQRAIPLLAAEMERRAFEGSSLENARNNTRSEQNRALNRAVFANISANMSGIDSYFQEFFKGLQELLEAAMPVIEEIGEAFKSIGPGTRRNLQAFGNVLGSIGNVMDSLDGIKVNQGIITLSSVLNGIADYIDDIADTIDLLRSDESWKTKLSGVSDFFVDQIKRIAELFVNSAIDKINIILPRAMEISPVSFGNSSTVDLSGVNALLGGVNESINKVNREAIKPLLNAQGGISDPTALPFGPVTNRQGESFTTVNQNNNLTVNIDGAQQPDQILGTIEDHINGMLRSAAINNPNSER